MTIVSAVRDETNASDFARADSDPVRRILRLLDSGSLHVVHQRAGLGVVIARGLIAAAIGEACRERCPVIGRWHSGGARLAEGVLAMDGIGRMFAAMVRASGQVLQLSLILGPAAGGAAYGAALTDLVIMSDGGRVFITGPDIVRSVTGERIDMSGLGGQRCTAAGRAWPIWSQIRTRPRSAKPAVS
jgi:acetyl-CoA/propionyl-CoA carboxylase carboxyl transferase subunit